MKAYILTRFSICDFTCKAFRISKCKDEELYKKNLFNEDRLNYKFKCFELVTLPSVVNQTNQNYEWYIYSSTYLPEKYKIRLIDITKKYENIRCIFIDSFKSFAKESYLPWRNNNYNTPYCCIRLDDDDGLSNTFIDSLQKYKDNDKSFISHPYGQNITIQNNKVVYGKKYNKSNIAIGLTSIGMYVYKGDHTKIHIHNHVIYDRQPDMYLINCSKYCDTKRSFR